MFATVHGGCRDLRSVVRDMAPPVRGRQACGSCGRQTPVGDIEAVHSFHRSQRTAGTLPGPALALPGEYVCGSLRAFLWSRGLLAVVENRRPLAGFPRGCGRWHPFASVQAGVGGRPPLGDFEGRPCPRQPRHRQQASSELNPHVRCPRWRKGRGNEGSLRDGQTWPTSLFHWR